MMNTTNRRKTSISNEQSQRPVFVGRTIKKGRFTIEDYSDCTISDYDNFIYQLQSCDGNRADTKKDEMSAILEIIELQNQQIETLKSLVTPDKQMDDALNTSSAQVNSLILQLKNMLNRKS